MGMFRVWFGVSGCYSEVMAVSARVVTVNLYVMGDLYFSLFILFHPLWGWSRRGFELLFSFCLFPTPDGKVYFFSPKSACCFSTSFSFCAFRSFSKRSCSSSEADLAADCPKGESLFMEISAASLSV